MNIPSTASFSVQYEPAAITLQQQRCWRRGETSRTRDRWPLYSIRTSRDWGKMVDLYRAHTAQTTTTIAKTGTTPQHTAAYHSTVHHKAFIPKPNPTTQPNRLLSRAHSMTASLLNPAITELFSLRDCSCLFSLVDMYSSSLNYYLIGNGRRFCFFRGNIFPTVLAQ